MTAMGTVAANATPTRWLLGLLPGAALLRLRHHRNQLKTYVCPLGALWCNVLAQSLAHRTEACTLAVADGHL